MKNSILLLLILLVTYSCQKDPKNALDSSENNQDTTSTLIDSTSIQSADLGGQQINFLDDKIDQGKVLFAQNNNSVIVFDHRSQTGKISVDNKVYNLTSLVFADNTYTLKGSGIEIHASEGDFKEITTDCLYGSFPSVSTSTPNGNFIVENVQLQDCPIY